MNKTFWVQPEESSAAYLSKPDLLRFIVPGSSLAVSTSGSWAQLPGMKPWV